MAKNDNLQDFLIDIANAIRNKKGTTDLINPQDFSSEIESISVGDDSKFDELVDGSITELTREDLANVTEIRYGAFIATPLVSVEIPSNVKIIGSSAFTGCEDLTTLIIDDGVEEIGQSAFAYVQIKDIVIPKTITTLNEWVFEGCANLTEVTMESSIPPSVTSSTFPSNVVSIYVPYSAYDSYVSQWSAYASKIVRLPAIPSSITVIVNNYLNELMQGVAVTIEGNGQTFTGTTNENGVFTQGDLQPATYTVSVADVDGFKKPSAVEIVVEENTQNSTILTYLEKPSISEIFGENTPEQIAEISAQISANNMTSQEVEATYGWKLGDIKDITLSTGETIQMQIIGFNHDDKSDGSGKAGITLQMKNSLNTTYSMNSGVTNEGGYPASAMKTSTIPNIKSKLPQEWQNVIKLVNKKSANGGKNYTETVTTSEALFLLSSFELGLNPSFGAAVQTEGVVYEYWNGKTDADRVKKVNNANASWWTRTAISSNTQSFLLIFKSGFASDSWSNSVQGVSFAFCV